MSDYYATSRTNFFRVLDIAVFKAAMEAFEVRVYDGTGADDGKLMLSAEGSFGTWPTTTLNHDTHEFDDIDFAGLLADHLPEGEVLVMVSAGAQKLCDVGGEAVAIMSNGERVELSLADIIPMAKAKFGIEPSPAHA